MEHMGEGLQLAGFLVVTVAILASLLAAAIGVAVFLYMTERKIVISKRERYPSKSQVPAEARS